MLIRFLPCVDFLMLCELMAVAEGLPTLFTFIGLLPGMNPLMFDEA